MKPRLSYFLLTALLASTQLGADACGGGGLIQDPGFDLWCDDRLCSWELDRGQILQVPTWHRGDDGVELVGPDVAISQLSAVTRLDNVGMCVRFGMLADVQETAEVMLEYDIDGDTTVEHEERIAGTGFRRVEFLVRVAPPFRAIRFRIAKRGVGRAVLADIDADETDEICPGDPIRSMPPESDAVDPTIDGAGGNP